MRVRRITREMLMDVLRRGTLARPPEPDMRHSGLKCELRRFVAGLNVAAVVAVEYPAPSLIVVTVIDVSEG